MPRMQIVQQTQSLPPNEALKPEKGGLPKNKHCARLKVSLIIIAGIIATLASVLLFSPFIGISVAMGLTMAMAMDLKDKKVIAGAATALTAIILAASLAVLFPLSAPIMLPLVCLVTTGAYIYGLTREFQVIHAVHGGSSK